MSGRKIRMKEKCTLNAPSVTSHKQIRSEAEASYRDNTAKRQKLFDDVLRKHEYKIGDLGSS